MIPFTKLAETNRRDLTNILPLKKPFTVLIEPSSLCNFRCLQCFQHDATESYFTRNRNLMPFDLFKKAINQLSGWAGEKIKVLKLSLYGEPLLNPHFCKMLRTAKAADVAERIETTTNASLLTDEVAEKMVEYQLDYVRVSIYAPNQRRHEEITGIPFDIRMIYRNIETLQRIKKECGSERPFVALKMLDTYGQENEDFFQLYQNVADEVYLDKPHNWISTGTEKFTDRLYQAKSVLVDKDMKEHEQPKKACPMAFTTMAIRSNGDVSPCCIDYIGGTNLGNIKRSSLQALWTSDEWYRFMVMQLEGRQIDNASCSHCGFYLNNHYIKDNVDNFSVEVLQKRLER